MSREPTPGQRGARSAVPKDARRRWLSEGRRALCAVRERSGAKVDTLAAMLDVSPAMVSRILTGTKRPGIDLAWRIETVLGIEAVSWARPQGQARRYDEAIGALRAMAAGEGPEAEPARRALEAIEVAAVGSCPSVNVERSTDLGPASRVDSSKPRVAV